MVRPRTGSPPYASHTRGLLRSALSSPVIDLAPRWGSIPQEGVDIDLSPRWGSIPQEGVDIDLSPRWGLSFLLVDFFLFL